MTSSSLVGEIGLGENRIEGRAERKGALDDVGALRKLLEEGDLSQSGRGDALIVSLEEAHLLEGDKLSVFGIDGLVYLTIGALAELLLDVVPLQGAGFGCGLHPCF